MSASITSGRRGGGDEVQRADGLVENHAFSLLCVAHVEEHQLIQLRNPWGSDKEWNGPWSDGSSLWQEHPAVATELGHVGAMGGAKADGLFWMAFEDFSRLFDEIVVASTREASAKAKELEPSLEPAGPSCVLL